jgi:hypothetical protein
VGIPFALVTAFGRASIESNKECFRAFLYSYTNDKGSIRREQKGTFRNASK